MILSDVDIIDRIADDGGLSIEPFDEDNVEPASVDLRLGSDFKVDEGLVHRETIDTRGEDDPEYVETSGEITLMPHQFALATTKEHISIPGDLAASVVGRSSLGRLGVSIHVTAGYCDPGFEGEITLELANHGRRPVKLYEGQRVCQIVFKELSFPSTQPYGHSGSQYQDQSGATASGMDFE